MALSSAHRSSLYHSLAPLVGADEATALLDQFPASDLDAPATKDFVRAESAVLRQEIADLRAELKAEIADLRAEVHALFRQQTIWLIGVVIAMCTLQAGMVALLIG